MTDLILPEDTSKSRLQKPARGELADDVATAADRIEAFWEKYPDGSILPEVDIHTVDDGQRLPYRVYTVRAYIRKDAQSERPDSVAHATRGENDPDEVTRQFPQETAETSAISRAIRNLGILAQTQKPATPPAAPPDDHPAPHPLAIARKAKKWSQKTLATAMIERGHDWSQAVVSKVENGHRTLKDEEVAALSELVGYVSP